MRTIAAILLLCTSLSAQTFNLSGLESLKVEIHDDYSVLTPAIKQKLLTETKIRLKSIGIDLDDKAPRGSLQIEIILNASTAFASPRVNISLNVIEKVQTFRKDFIRTEALTYHNSSLGEYDKQNISLEVYSFYYDKLLLEFIENYLNDNPK